ncbi:MAG TPA: phosphodiester glycosidase family protein [Paracoccaceae bacterium]|nr:phosphodiester glycosidase family protein [Paracoccaceae bacterium]HMO71471.1 phosphodiester glycosidase family protein [Paracoccaceae bacterium]
MTGWARAALALALGLGLGGPALGSCRTVEHEGLPHTVCEAGPGQDLRVFHTAADGAPYSTFSRVAAAVEAEGGRLAFATNGGMYHADRTPVGLLVEGGVERARLVTAEGPGNFGLLPNGVFCIGADGRFAVIESRRFARERPECRHATQSGPMLVIGGDLHPRFIPGSDSLHLRNGVGVSPDGTRAYLVMSGTRVNFHTFARVFRDHLGLRDALYLDGQVSRMYAPGIGRNDLGLPMGPILGLVAPGG